MLFKECDIFNENSSWSASQYSECVLLGGHSYSRIQKLRKLREDPISSHNGRVGGGNDC